MRKVRYLLVGVMAPVLVIVLAGCGLVGPAVRLLGGATATPISRSVEKVVVVTPTPARDEAAPAVIVADNDSAILQAVYRKVNPSVVYIENQTQVSRSANAATLATSSGSGFVWDNQGHIVTNNHVVEGADRLEVTFSDGVALPAELIGTDADSDLAVIKIDPELVTLTPVAQGDINAVQVGQRAIAIGNPFGLVGTMTSGIVSAMGRSLASNPDNASSYNIPQVIQTDAAINPGNSGGPLLNDNGEVIGVNFQIRSESGSDSGVGFAIPINIVQRVVPALIDDGVYRHAYLGIRGQTYSPAWAEALGFSTDVRGAYVADVVAGGPASKAGLQAADRDTDVILGLGASGPVYLQSGGDLIVAIDDQPVKTFDDLLIYLESFKSPGDKIDVTVLRPGEGEQRVTITLGQRPSQTQ